MKLIVKNKLYQLTTINCCDNFPTFLGDKFSLGSNGNMVEVVEIDGVKVKSKASVLERIEQLTLNL